MGSDSSLTAIISVEPLGRVLRGEEDSGPECVKKSKFFTIASFADAEGPRGSDA